jgi:DNA repair exonuclease SbcCD ATPase subunit
MKDAAEVLNQRSIQQNKKTEEIKEKIKDLEAKLSEVDDLKVQKKAFIESELSELKDQLMALTGTTKKASFVQK